MVARAAVLILASACSLLGQAQRPTREMIEAQLQAQTKEQIIASILDRMFPPSLVGRELPKSLRAPSGPTIAVFMASTCPHCVKIADYVRGLQASATKATVLPVFYVADTGAEAMWPKHGVLTREDADILRIQGTPTTAVVDASGKVVVAFVGELKPEERAVLEKVAREGL